MQSHSQEKEVAYQSLLGVLTRMRRVMRVSVFVVIPLAQIGGYGPQSDQSSASRAFDDPVVRDLLLQFEEQWGVTPWEIVSVDYRTRLVKNILAASQPRSLSPGPMPSSSSFRGGR